jgi:hypothetical protein
VFCVLVIAADVPIAPPTTDANPFNPTVISVLITAAGVIISAIVGAVTATYSARLKSKEIEITYQQRLQDTYLQNARQYITSVYVPINIALRNLADHFRLLQEQKAAPLTKDATDYFRDACREYERVISDLVKRGADSFLTSELDEQLQSFNSFLRLSMDATEPVRRMVITVNFSVPFTGYHSRHEIAQQVHGRLKYLSFLYLGAWRWSLSGVGISYRRPELLSAPIESPEFEERISVDIPKIRFLIKEVTLGSQITPERNRAE